MCEQKLGDRILNKIHMILALIVKSLLEKINNQVLKKQIDKHCEKCGKEN